VLNGVAHGARIMNAQYVHQLSHGTVTQKANVHLLEAIGVNTVIPILVQQLQ
jgi:hypothetical protein